MYIDDEQMAWFEQVLQRNTDKPIVIFTHAPPMGSGLKVVENVHVKNRCAWLNHSDRPQRFIRLVEQHPNIKLWFSGHYHLSQVRMAALCLQTRHQHWCCCHCSKPDRLVIVQHRSHTLRGCSWYYSTQNNISVCCSSAHVTTPYVLGPALLSVQPVIAFFPAELH